jgi:hypothetical protein
MALLYFELRTATCFGALVCPLAHSGKERSVLAAIVGLNKRAAISSVIRLSHCIQEFGGSNCQPISSEAEGCQSGSATKRLTRSKQAVAVRSCSEARSRRRAQW